MKAMVQFGSQISGGANNLSDKDLLIINSYKNKNRLVKKYSKEGYSVSFYTPIQLSYMRDKGSLFLQHLRLESKIISDKENLFKEFINSCVHTKPTISEIGKCRRSLYNALKIPKEEKLNAWLSDYIFVLSRDYFVKYFALKGKLVFNINELCHEIHLEFGLTKKDTLALLDLRKIKNIYRTGVAQLSPSWDSLEQWKKVLNIVLNLQHDNKDHFTKLSYLNFYKVNEFNSTYELLRYIESLRLLFPKIKNSVAMEALVNKLIKCPNNYSSTSVLSKKFLECYLSKFTKKANNLYNLAVFSSLHSGQTTN
jgi:hypothetical protein